MKNDCLIPVVAVATGTMNAGGTESLLMETFRQATGRIRYILLIHYENKIETGVFDNEINELGIQVEYIRSVGSLGIRGYIHEFKKFVDKVGHIDAVHSHLNGAGGVISLAAYKAGIPHRICHCHADIHFTGSLVSRLKSEISLCAMKLLIERYATGRWACSEAAWRRLYMPWHKQVVVNNMIDTRKYVASENQREKTKERFNLSGRFVVGAVGRVAPIKNYECILRAIAGTDAYFVCFGRFDLKNVYCRSLDNLAHELGVSDQVRWMGNSNDISHDIHCIDLFVMSSFTEGFGMAAIEAQAASIPSLLSTGVPKVVDVGAGLVKFLDPYNIDGWHREISSYSGLKILPQEKIVKLFEKNGFDSPLAVKQIEETYIAIIKK